MGILLKLRQVKLLLLILIITALLLIYQNTATFSFEDIKTTVVRQLDKAQIQLGFSANSKITVYSTRDKTGLVEFSDSVPMEDANAKSIIIDTNTNLVPAVPINNKVPVKEEKLAKDSITDISPLTPYTEPGKIKQLVNDAKNIEEVLNNRKTDLDQQLEGM